MEKLKKSSSFWTPANKIADYSNKSVGKKRLIFYGTYTIIFFICALAVFSWFIINNKTFVWENDGIAQHYNILTYYGVYLRELAKNVLHGNFTLPMWDFSIGFGADVFESLTYYVIGDPFALFSAIVPAKYTEILYNVLIIARLYFAGIAFCAYCRYFKKDFTATLCGAMIYVFCGYALFASVRHPYFTNPMIYLPMFCLGAEKLMTQKKPWVFIISVFLAAVSNFYFFYMVTALAVIYVIFRFFTIVKEHRIKNFFITLLKFIGCYAAGVLPAAFILLPTVFGFLNNGRLDNPYSANMLFYPGYYYANMLGGIITCNSSTDWTVLGYTPFGLAAVVCLFAKRSKKYFSIKVATIVLTVFLLIPFFGYAFNGFGYISNRWCFGYSFLIAYIVAVMLPHIVAHITNKQKTALAVTGGVLCIAFTVIAILSSTVFYASLSAYFLVISIICCGLPRLSHCINYRRIVQLSLILLVIVCVAFNGDFRYNTDQSSYLNEYLNSGEPVSLLNNAPNSEVKNLNDNSFYRIEESGGVKNDSLYSHTYGTSSFYSLQTEFLTNYIKEMQVPVAAINIITGLGCRTYLNTLASVKYYTCYNGSSSTAPYGFENISTEESKEKDIEIYQNKNALPLGYTYSSYITTDDFKKLSSLEKQQAMMQGIVSDHIEGFQQTTPSYTNKNISFTMQDCSNADLDGNQITVYESNTTVKLEFSTPSNCESYLTFTGLTFCPTNPNNFMSHVLGKNPSKSAINKYTGSNAFWSPADESALTVKSKYESQKLTCLTTSHSYYCGIHDYTANLGYCKGSQNYCTIKFAEPGVYTFDSMSIESQPMDDFDKQVDELKADTMTNTKISTNSVSGDISLTDDKILCLTVPYSQGWTATVDGTETEIQVGNLMYMALPLSAGNHHIELHYTTPYLKIGFIISAASICVIILLSVIYNILKKKHKIHKPKT